MGEYWRLEPAVTLAGPKFACFPPICGAPAYQKKNPAPPVCVRLAATLADANSALCESAPMRDAIHTCVCHLLKCIDVWYDNVFFFLRAPTLSASQLKR